MMAEVYEHQKPDYKVIQFLRWRMQEIEVQVEKLQLEHDLYLGIVDKYKSLVCRTCSGEGTIMKPISGCECDGPRMHTCSTCKGTGEPA